MTLLSSLEELFGLECLALDESWLAEVRRIRQGWVPLSLVASHLERVLHVRASPAELVAAAAMSVDLLVLAEDGASLRRRYPCRRISFPDTLARCGACGEGAGVGWGGARQAASMRGARVRQQHTLELAAARV